MTEKFEYKSINIEQKQSIESCKMKATMLLSEINEQCPDSREKALAITKLEECVMWLSKAISHN